MVWSVLVFILGFSAIPLVNNAPLVVIFFALINCAYSVFSTVLKAWFADRLTAEKKARIFSLNYTILNIGWTVGPPIGTLLVMHSINLPFWLAPPAPPFRWCLFSCFFSGMAPPRPSRAPRLVAFGVAARPGAAVVYLLRAAGLLRRRAFASCLSQYVLVVASSDFAEKVVAVVLPVNAAVVVALQYAVGRRLSARNIRPLMTFGTVCFVIGLVGFMFSGASLWAWGISAAIFTLGEVIYAPGEYMLIDHIAPPGMKASYFSAQSLGWLGAAFNPMLTGLILTHLPHWSLFVILIVAIVAAWLMIFRGINARPWQPDSPLANA
ncbi:MFS transporter [Klebsiella pneumoniae]|nr:MFS transporter [Klebsiella pneumoniae]